MRVPVSSGMLDCIKEAVLSGDVKSKSVPSLWSLCRDVKADSVKQRFGDCLYICLSSCAAFFSNVNTVMIN